MFLSSSYWKCYTEIILLIICWLQIIFAIKTNGALMDSKKNYNAHFNLQQNFVHWLILYVFIYTTEWRAIFYPISNLLPSCKSGT